MSTFYLKMSENFQWEIPMGRPVKFVFANNSKQGRQNLAKGQLLYVISNQTNTLWENKPVW